MELQPVHVLDDRVPSLNFAELPRVYREAVLLEEVVKVRGAVQQPAIIEVKRLGLFHEKELLETSLEECVAHQLCQLTLLRCCNHSSEKERELKDKHKHKIKV